MTYPEASATNTATSLWAYIDQKYTLTEKYLWGFNDLNTDDLTEWVQFWYQTTGRRFYRNVGQGNPGGIVHWEVGAEIYVKRTEPQMMRTLVIADAIRALLRRAVIEIRDWVGSGAVIAQLTGQEVTRDTPVRSEDLLSRHSLAFDYQWMEQYARATQ